MKKFIATVIFITGLIVGPFAYAVTVVLCQEEDGSRSYRSSCPPGTSQINEQKYYIVKQAEPSLPQITLYFVPDCQWCREIRTYFAQYDIPIIEKDVTENAVLQQELFDKAGELIVPTVELNDTIYRGYFPQEMDKNLENLGFTVE